MTPSGGATQEILVLKLQNRDCAGCTRCCEGWLWGEAYGTQFAIGRPCYFLRQNTCSIYPVRPTSPCKTFLCGWKADPRIPEWMWPHNSGLIVLPKILRPQNLAYLLIVRAGREITEPVLAWAEQHGAQHEPVVVNSQTGVRVFGSEQFRTAFNQTQQ